MVIVVALLVVILVTVHLNTVCLCYRMSVVADVSVSTMQITNIKGELSSHQLMDPQNYPSEQVEMRWGSERRQPGEKVTLNLKGGPGSLCGLTVVDRSVTYMRPDLQLSESNILQRLDQYHIDQYSYPSQVTPDWEYCVTGIALIITF